jgi:hypothetical protein
MDELQNKRRQRAAPLELLEAKLNSELSTQQLTQLCKDKAFENQLSKAFKTSVPEGLADKVLLNQRTQTRRKQLRHWSLAASLMIASLFSFVLSQSSPVSIEKQALAHVYHELDRLQLTQQIAPSEVLAQLKELQLNMPKLPNNITYAAKCGLAGKRSLHMIATINGSPITILVTPLKLKSNTQFKDQRFAGITYQNERDGFIVIGEDESLVQQVWKALAEV